MKKGLCIILSALILSLSFTACSKKPDKDTDSKKNNGGSSYVDVTDENGEKVTDANGEALTSAVTEKDAGKKEDPTKDKGKDTGKDNKANTGDIKVNQNVMDNLVNSDGLDMTAAEKDLIPEGSTTKKTTLFEDNVQKIIKTGKFTVEMSVTSNGTKSPMKLVFDNNRMYASFSLNGMEAGILYMNDKAYILLPNLFTVKGYIESDEANEGMDEIFGSFDGISDNGGTYVGSTKVTIDGKTYTCEEYKNKEGAISKYYFDGKDWKRYECISDEGNMVYEIKSFSGKVDDSVFSLKGYTKIDEKALTALMGGMQSTPNPTGKKSKK